MKEVEKRERERERQDEYYKYILSELLGNYKDTTHSVELTYI